MLAIAASRVDLSSWPKGMRLIVRRGTHPLEPGAAHGPHIAAVAAIADARNQIRTSHAIG